MECEKCNYAHAYPFACIVFISRVNQPFPKRQILDSSNLKEFADDNFKFDENGQKVFQMGRKHSGKRRNCSLRAISSFPTVFSKDSYCRHIKTRACLGKDLTKDLFSMLTSPEMPSNPAGAQIHAL